MEGVRPAPDGGVELPTRGVAKLGVELVGQQREVFYGVVWNRDQVAGQSLVIVVDALDGEVVVVRTLASHRWPGADSQRTRLRDSGAQQREVQYACASSSGSGNAQVLRKARVIVGLNLGRGGVDRGSYPGDFDGLAGRSRRECSVQRAGLVQHNVNLLHDGAKSRRRNRDSISAHRQVI